MNVLTSSKSRRVCRLRLGFPPVASFSCLSHSYLVIVMFFLCWTQQQASKWRLHCPLSSHLLVSATDWLFRVSTDRAWLGTVEMCTGGFELSFKLLNLATDLELTSASATLQLNALWSVSAIKMKRPGWAGSGVFSRARLGTLENVQQDVVKLVFSRAMSSPTLASQVSKTTLKKWVK